jgi:hypothetical protein
MIGLDSSTDVLSSIDVARCIREHRSDEGFVCAHLRRTTIMKIKTIGAVMLGVVIVFSGEFACADSEFGHNQEQESDGAWGWEPKESDGNDGPAPDGGSSLFDGSDGGGGGFGGSGGFGSGGGGGVGSALMNAGFVTLVTSMLQSSSGASGGSDGEATVRPVDRPSDSKQQQEGMANSEQKATS